MHGMVGEMRDLFRSEGDNASMRLGYAEGVGSPSESSHPRGSFGRIERMRILERTAYPFPIDLLSNFQFEREAEEADRIEALRTHVGELLREMGFDP